MSRHAQHGMFRRGRYWFVTCRCGHTTPRRRFVFTALLAHRRHRSETYSPIGLP